MRVFLDLMWFFRNHQRRYLSGIIFLIVVSLLGLVPPVIVGRAINRMQHQTLTAPVLEEYLAIILVTALSSYGLRYLWRVQLFGGSILLATVLRDRLYEHFTRLSPEFYQSHRIGDLMAHATNDVQAIQETAGDGVMMMVDSVVSGLAVVITMAVVINWKLTLISLLPLPLMAVVITHYGRILHERFTLAQAAFSDINDRVQEYISGIRVVRAFGQEAFERQSFVELSRDVVEKNVAVAKIDSLFDPTISVIVGFSYFLALAVGSLYVVHGTMNIGNLTTFTLYLGQLIWPMMAFGFLFNVVERGSASYDRVQQLLEIDPQVVDAKDALESVPSGSILFDIPSFRYPHTGITVLQSIHLSLAKGTTLGIVGRTGAGKTTLLRLLLREFDLQEGDITIGGTSIYAYQLQALRQAVAYAPQDDFLFSMSIRENIAFQSPDASLYEIQEKARMAGIHDDILDFPLGYDTIVGERGVTLSGGQKQRISIARALLAEAEILILDDTLSAVDARTESAILNALKRNRHGRTTLIATHRLSAVEHADQIIVLEHGRIVEQGTHTDLLQQRGRYFDMYQRQQLENLVQQGGVAHES
ncbi:MAG: multidrug ABC transporter permease/ATP-binding protein [Sulfobacillus acidophilus]|uniref:Multidrug ABC transporter permease/ATP-binding protein n=1 Tax=Sulfobacillus acidophilus TaxID=53633 RepID=A0A2T2WMG0_9FIRM|nr:MAG: multidrug ABC transporter permease/ATP-binding protein [Sulfobacillus acidophilus]